LQVVEPPLDEQAEEESTARLNGVAAINGLNV
jgi:hypothetical protein